MEIVAILTIFIFLLAEMISYLISRDAAISAHNLAAPIRSMSAALGLLGRNFCPPLRAIAPIAAFDHFRHRGKRIHDIDPSLRASTSGLDLNLLAAVESRVAFESIHRLKSRIIDCQKLALNKGISFARKGRKAEAVS